jgi:hypothetical protein
MSRFLKFSNRLVNTAFIKRVDIEPDKYTLFLANSYHTGIIMFGTGLMRPQDDIVWASKIDHPESYKIIDDWINHMPN